jgi:hypothetical protein
VRQWALLFAPPLLIGSMLAAFRGLSALLGPKVGYFAGFVCYWLVWCLAFPLWILRGIPVSRLFRRSADPLGEPAWLGLLLLLFPALGAALTIFARRLRDASPPVLLSSAALAIVNATGEEMLWRGIYARSFPRQVMRGYLYPAVGFARLPSRPAIHPSQPDARRHEGLSVGSLLHRSRSWLGRLADAVHSLDGPHPYPHRFSGPRWAHLLRPTGQTRTMRGTTSQRLHSHQRCKDGSQRAL